ncbi:hypothetical protein WJX72_010461 [[Myrmecia] bisecta]|uniref:Leucine-rich repeat-containing N-terminal plant-type domain-containing protein n=1 Tax=[Myrmecia] bisecta TaxID=41462 RepID=A0AAW1PYQ6_9CHLO
MALALTLRLAMACMMAAAVAAFTLPDQVDKLLGFKAAMLAKSKDEKWGEALRTWVCPTDGSTCDPCTAGWDHMYCRGTNAGVKKGDGSPDGYVTNIHISDCKVDGDIPEELCVFDRITELDMDGGFMTGTIPRWLTTCFPFVREIDLSYNNLTGTLPDFIAEIKTLQQFEVGHNFLTGTIPEVYGTFPQIFEFDFECNDLTGSLPASFMTKNFTESLYNINMAGNDFEGDLGVLANNSLTIITTKENPRLCGDVPPKVAAAQGFDTTETNLYTPCSLTPTSTVSTKLRGMRSPYCTRT